ncbi:hypothetical protein ACGFNU_39590 [Spirillospora sp. NPDC048911]|uniref:acyl-CoA dehydrogenase family protein n=1 Tax=Spirillospora sp. NPDC048911 TaxID=3364527 RepID=UPI00371A7E85
MNLIDLGQGHASATPQGFPHKAIPAGFFDYPDGLAPPERQALTYQRLRHAVLAAPRADELLTHPALLCALLERAAVADPALFHLMLLHYTLVMAPIVRFGDEHTAETRRRLEAMETFGMVAMTEAGRSNSHMAPGTVARFVPERRSFVLTTPDAAATKFPTSAGHPRLPKTAVVYARLLVAGKDHGVFIFLVPLRGPDGTPAEGAQVFPAPDNHQLPLDWAAVRFTELEVPFGAWLAAGAKIAADGTFHDPMARDRSALAMSTTPHVWRSIIAAAAALCRASAALLVHHSTGRPTLGGLAPGRPLLDYRNQQEAVLTALARGHALTAVADHARAAAPAQSSGMATWTPWAGIDLTLPLLKSVTTALAEQTAALCRTHCGAPGFAASDRLNGYRGLLHGYLSAGGDNQLILFDVARAMLEKDRYDAPGDSAVELSLSLPGCLTAAQALEARLVRELADHVTDPGSLTSWNPHLSQAGRTARAFADRRILEILHNAPAPLRPLFDWYALDWAERNTDLLIDEAVARPGLSEQIREQRDELCAALLPRVDDLIEAFELPELRTPAFWSAPWT